MTKEKRQKKKTHYNSRELHNIRERHEQLNIKTSRGNKHTRTSWISSLTFSPVFTTFKHNFLARSLLSAYQCRGYLHDNVTSKFAEKTEDYRAQSTFLTTVTP